MLALRNGLIAGLLFSGCLLGLQVSFLLSRGGSLARGPALEDAVLNYSSATLSGVRDVNSRIIGDLGWSFASTIPAQLDAVAGHPWKEPWAKRTQGGWTACRYRHSQAAR